MNNKAMHISFLGKIPDWFDPHQDVPAARLGYYDPQTHIKVLM